jgi:hypothetical protein
MFTLTCWAWARPTARNACASHRGMTLCRNVNGRAERHEYKHTAILRLLDVSRGGEVLAAHGGHGQGSVTALSFSARPPGELQQGTQLPQVSWMLSAASLAGVEAHWPC